MIGQGGDEGAQSVLALLLLKTRLAALGELLPARMRCDSTRGEVGSATTQLPGQDLEVDTPAADGERPAAE